MNSKTSICTFVVAMCLLISVVRSEECDLLNPGTCGESGGCCFKRMRTVLMKGNCTHGTEGEQCMGVRLCTCKEGLECKDQICVATTTTTTTTTMQSTTVATESTTPQAEATPPAVTTVVPVPPSTEAPEITP